MAMHMQREIDTLKKKILALCSFVEENVRFAVSSIDSCDIDLAQRVCDRDAEIDRMEIDVEEDCLKILALHQPVAIDLRFIIAVLKINNDLERVGDLAVNIAQQTRYLHGQGTGEALFEFKSLCRKALGMLRTSLDALMNMDASLARNVLAADDEVDAINSQMHSQALDAIRANPAKIDLYFSYIATSRYLERIADHCTNIAEDIIYLLEGEIVRHSSEEAD